MALTSPALAAPAHVAAAHVPRRRGAALGVRVGGLVLIAVAATALAGCDGGVPTRLTFSDTEKVKVTEIVITGGSGDVMVRTSAIGETRIWRTVTYRDRQEPEATYKVTGTVLSVDTRCGGDCSVTYDIEAPTGVAVRGTLGSGEVSLTGVATADVTVGSGNVAVTAASGAVKARTRSGNIVVQDLKGAAHLTATSGNIEGMGLGSGAVVAEATSGDINLTLARPGPVTAKATSGSVALMVPDSSYQVRTSAASGEQSVDVPHDPAAKHLLDVRATSGDVRISRG
jgi:hypothetical protein